MPQTELSKYRRTKQPLGSMAYERICRNIITLQYEPGQILDEKHLMADLGLGRTPIREALLRLSCEGWIEMQPNRGAVVPSITLQGTRAMFEAMKILETGVASLAIQQNPSPYVAQLESASDQVKAAVAAGEIPDLVEANHLFHFCFAQCARNEYLIRAMTEISNMAKRLAYLSYSNDLEMDRPLQTHYDSVVTEHETIIHCLKVKNETLLKEIVIRHINTFQHRIVAYMMA
ncbi:MAG: GntR family transcriptional regulator [Desulfobacterales bacterium]